MPLSRQFGAASAAYRFRDRLTGDERIEVEAYYLNQVNTSATIETYLAHQGLIQNNLALALARIGEWARSESVLVVEIAKVPAGSVPIVQLYTNLVVARVGQGKFDKARETLEDMQRDYPGAFTTERAVVQIAWGAFGVDSAAAAAERMERSPSLLTRGTASRATASLAGRAGAASTLRAAFSQGEGAG
jgi:hypothetical protein